MKSKSFLNNTGADLNSYDIISSLGKYQIEKNETENAFESNKIELYFDTPKLELLNKNGYFKFVKEFNPTNKNFYFEYKMDNIDTPRTISVRASSETNDPCILPEFNEIAKSLGTENNLLSTLILNYENYNFNLLYNNLFLISNALNPDIKLINSFITATIFNDKSADFVEQNFELISMLCKFPMTYNKNTNKTALEQFDMLLSNFSDVMLKLNATPYSDNAYKFFMNSLGKNKPSAAQSEIEPFTPDQNQIDSFDEDYDPIWGDMDIPPDIDSYETEFNSLNNVLPFDEDDVLPLDENDVLPFDEIEDINSIKELEKDFNSGNIDPNDLAESQIGEDH